MNKKIFTLLIFIAIVFYSFTSHTKRDMEPILVVDFQDFFLNDTISIKFGKCLILDREILNTMPDIGMTGVSLVLHDDGSVNIGTEKNKSLHCKKPDKNKIYLELTLNNHTASYCILLLNGKYIGFSKSNDGKLSLRQSSKQFIYD